MQPDCGQRHFEYHAVFHKQDFWDNQVSNIYAINKDIDAADFIIQKSEIDAVLWMNLNACIDMVTKAKAPNCIHIDELRMISSVIMDCK